MHEVRHISIAIDRKPSEVYAFASDPRNLPRWASGLARSKVRKDGDGWTVHTPLGKARLRFAPKNDFGVMDHDVELVPGVTAHNPMRVVPNGDGSEFTFSLIRQPGMSKIQFVAEAKVVEKDLRTLKELLEHEARG